MKTNSRQTGISLVEVLVVLVLLLVGILSVIRLFPPGFLINKQAESTTLATRLAKQEVDRFTNSAVNLMDDIIPVRWNGTAFAWDPNATPDDLSDVQSTPSTVWDYYFSNVNKCRRIIGEQIRVPLPSPTSAGRGSIYMLSSGPFMDVDWSGPDTSIFVTGAPMIRRVSSSTIDPPPVRSAAQYAIDYDSAQIGVAAVGYPRQFLLTYSYYDANWQAQTVVDQPCPSTTDAQFPGGIVPAGYSGWITIPVPTGSKGLVPGTDKLYRRFLRIATDAQGNPAQPWSADPYEFYVWSPRLAGPNGLNANVGVLVFNPNGRDYTEQSAYGPQPLTARIDYDVLDWRIIREDRPMPATPPYQVALTLKDIRKLGQFNDDQTVYDGLFPGSGVDLLVYNVGSGTLVPPVDPQSNQPIYNVNYREGTVTFSDAYGNANSSGTFRFFYKARGDWSLQIQKGAASYTRRYDSNLALDQFYVGGGTSGGLNTRIYFPITEAGKTVAVRMLRLHDNSGAYGEVTNSSFQLQGNPAQFENVGGHVLTWATMPPGYTLDPTITDVAVGVQGVSFRARVVWRNGSNVVQTANGNVVRTRWHRVDDDTILTRSPQ